MAVDQSTGFKYMGRRGNVQEPTILERYFKDTETLTKGDLINIESGEADLAATGDTTLAGMALETKAGTDSTTLIEFYSDPDAVYAVYDPNARELGDTLDISGTTGQQTVAATSNADLIVVGGFGADELTLVMINHGSHFLN